LNLIQIKTKKESKTTGGYPPVVLNKKCYNVINLKKGGPNMDPVVEF